MPSERDGPPPAATDVGFRITLIGTALIVLGAILALIAVIIQATGGDPSPEGPAGGGLAALGCLILFLNGRASPR